MATDGRTPLLEAGHKNLSATVPIIQMLIVAGADVNVRHQSRDKYGGRTALFNTILHRIKKVELT